MYEFWLSKTFKKNKDDMTVEDDWDINFIYRVNFKKKGHNSGAPMQNVTKQMACTITLHIVQVYKLSFRCLDNCGICIRMKTAT